MTTRLRSALLASAFTSGAFLAFASPAAAQCVVTPAATPVTGTIVCSTTSTVNDTYNNTANDERNYNVDTTAGAVSLTVNSGATVSTSGLALSHVAGSNAINVVNNGTVSTSAPVSAGGGSTLEVTAFNASPVNYSGEGNVLNTNTTSGHALDFFMQGSGNLIANVGLSGGPATTISTLATGSSAIQVNRLLGTGGAVTITTTSDTTLGATGGAGINVDTTAGGKVLVANNATIKSAGAANTLGNGIRVVSDANGTGDVEIGNSGAIGTSTDRAQLSGITAAIQRTTSTGTVQVTSQGPIYSALYGIYTNNEGTGASTVTTLGGVTTGGTYGIYSRNANAAPLTITTGTGAVNATTAGTGVGIGAINFSQPTTITTGTGAVIGGGYGIQADSNSGSQSITTSGAVTGTTVAGIHSDTTGNRNITINSGSAISGGAEAILLTDTGTATIQNSGVVGAASTGLALMGSAAGATTFNNNSGATLNGRLTFGGGNDVLTNAGTFNTQGTTDFGAGADTFTNTGTLNLTGATTFTGLETLNLGGTTNLGAFTLNGTGTLKNTGTLTSNGGSLLGFTTQSNTGTLNLSGVTTVAAQPFTNSGVINAVNGAATLTGQTSFTNTGTINLVDGAANDVLTINSSFAGGAGSRLAVDVDDTVADELVITGAITGTTAVDANLIGTGALVAGGVQIVDGQSTSTANAFVLGNVSGGSPLVSYAVAQNGSDYFLTGSLTEVGFQPLLIGTMVPDLWYPSANEVNANLAVPYKGEGLGFWVQGYASRDKYGDSEFEQTIAGVDYVVDQEVSMGRLGVQAGIDVGMGDTGRIGLTGGFGTHRGKGLTELDADGWNIGAYAAFGGTMGFHGEALIKHDRYDVKFREGPLDDEDTDVRSTGIDGSIGYRMPMGGENGSIDLFAGASHVRNKVDDFGAFGLTYDYKDLDSTRGRAGARWNIGGDIQPYVSGTVFHEFADNGRVVLNDGVNNFDLDVDRRGTWGRIEAGIGGSPSRFPSFGAWVDVGDVRGIGARLGMRFGGRAAAPMPVPAAVPVAEPAPAPATQTCYDGSVILATDTCPVPPPPPAPAPAPERG